MHSGFRGFIGGAALVCFLACALVAPARAAMIGTDHLLGSQVGSQAREAQQARVQAFLARQDVSAHLQAWGVPAEAAAARVAALSDEELSELARDIDEAPAGGDGLAVLGLVFVVLIVLELVGVTNIFSRL